MLQPHKESKFCTLTHNNGACLVVLSFKRIILVLAWVKMWLRVKPGCFQGLKQNTRPINNFWANANTNHNPKPKLNPISNP